MRKKLSGYRRPSAKVVSGIIVCLAFLATSLLGIGAVATAQDQPNEMSFKTPEEAVTFFMQAVAQGDISQIMQVWAVDEMSEKVRFDLYADWVLTLMNTSPAPSDYPFYAEINKAQFSSQLLNQVKNLAYGLLTTEKEMVSGYPVFIDKEGVTQFVEEFVEEVDPARLAQLQVTEIGVPFPEDVSSERYPNYWSKSAQIYGADEFTERVVLFLFEENYYYTGFSLLRYGENWKVGWAHSSLGETNVLGAPLEITKENFLQWVDSN